MRILKTGEVIRVPCRSCGRFAVPVRLAPDLRRIACRRCANATDVEVYRAEGEWRLKTAPAGPLSSVAGRKCGRDL